MTNNGFKPMPVKERANRQPPKQPERYAVDPAVQWLSDKYGVLLDVKSPRVKIVQVDSMKQVVAEFDIVRKEPGLIGWARNQLGLERKVAEIDVRHHFNNKGTESHLTVDFYGYREGLVRKGTYSPSLADAAESDLGVKSPIWEKFRAAVETNSDDGRFAFLNPHRKANPSAAHSASSSRLGMPTQ